MSVWVAAVVAKGYQYEAELDLFQPGWIWGRKKCLPGKLCKCDIVGYPASPLSTDESRLTLSQNSPITQLMPQKQDLIAVRDLPFKDSI
jgi:hypothetical protein